MQLFSSTYRISSEWYHEIETKSKIPVLSNLRTSVFSELDGQSSEVRGTKCDFPSMMKGQVYLEMGVYLLSNQNK